MNILSTLIFSTAVTTAITLTASPAIAASPLDLKYAYGDARPETRCFAAIDGLNAALYMERSSEASKILDKRGLALIDRETMRAVNELVVKKAGNGASAQAREETTRAIYKEKLKKVRYLVSLEKEESSANGIPLRHNVLSTQRFAIRDLLTNQQMSIETEITTDDLRSINRRACGENSCPLDAKNPLSAGLTDLHKFHQYKIAEKLSTALPTCDGLNTLPKDPKKGPRPSAVSRSVAHAE